MGFSIEKVTVTARARALKAEYSIELAQDLKAIHGLDAEQGLSNILSLRSLLKSTVKLLEPSTPTLLLVLRTTLLPLVSSTSTLTPMVAGLLRSSRVCCSKSSEMQRNRSANSSWQGQHPDRSADVASALGMAGVLDYAPALAGNNGLTLMTPPAPWLAPERSHQGLC